MLNRVVLVGRLTADPSLRYTPSGTAVCNFTLAVERPFTNQQGEREADFINVQVWRKAAENVANYLRKGSLAGVDGRIQTRSYEKDGKRVYVTEVVADMVRFLESKGKGTGEQKERNTGQNQANTSVNDDPFAIGSEPIDIDDFDSLPF